MTEPSYDRSGAARQALQEIYRDYGLAGVDNEALLNQLLPDLLAGSPRETSLLRAAASAGVGSMLMTRINGGMARDAAVRDVAAVLTERSAFDPTACLWVASEYATALGHPATAGPATSNIPVVPPVTRPVGTDAQPTTMDTGPMPAPGPVPMPYPGPNPAPYPGPQPAPYPGPAPMPMPMPYPNPNPKKSSAGLVIGIVAGAVALICVLGLVGYFVSKGPDKCTGSSCVTLPPPPSSHPPVSPSTPPVTLANLIPSDLDASTDCEAYRDTTPSGVTGLVNQLNCTESSFSTIEAGTVDAYLFTSLSALHTSYAALNTTYEFHPSEAGTKCPPSGDNDDGHTTWNHVSAPSVTVGTIECYTSKNDGHVYIWSNEPEMTIMVVAVSSDISFSTLEKWWETTGCCRTT